MEKLIYCNKKVGPSSTCGKIAAFKVKLRTKDNLENGETVFKYRCQGHKNTGTVNKKVIEMVPHDQSVLVDQIKSELAQYINKKIFSSRERNKYPLIGRYIKDCGIMCNPNNNSTIWKYVYYHQIINK